MPFVGLAAIVVMVLAALPFLLSNRLGRMLGFGLVAAGVAGFLASPSAKQSALHEIYSLAGWTVNQGVR
jgi:hypothetical protein